MSLYKRAKKILTAKNIIYLFIYLRIICYIALCRLGNRARALDTENKTREDCNQDATGVRRVVHYVYNDPTQPCYTQYFVAGRPPIRLRAVNDAGIRYICQPPTPQPPAQQAQQTYYATMFDEDLGIAVFSAYTLTRARFSGKDKHPWCRTPGNLLTFLKTKSHTLAFYQFSIISLKMQHSYSIYGPNVKRARGVNRRGKLRIRNILYELRTSLVWLYTYIHTYIILYYCKNTKTRKLHSHTAQYYIDSKE